MPHERDDLIVEGYIQSEIYNGITTRYPDDIRHSVVSFYHTPSYFAEGGNFCTLNKTKSILTCKFSCFNQITSYCICRIIDYFCGIIGFCLLTKLIILYHCYDTLKDRVIAWMIMIPRPGPHEFTEFEENLSAYVWLWVLMGYCISYETFKLLQFLNIIQLPSKTCESWGWFTRMNACYGSIIMPSTLADDDKFIEYEYKLRIRECSDELIAYVGLIPDDDINDSHLNGTSHIMHNKHFRQSFACLMGQQGQGAFTCGVGDIVTILYRPDQGWIKFSANGNDYLRTRLVQDASINFRFLVAIVDIERHEINLCRKTKSITIEML